MRLHPDPGHLSVVGANTVPFIIYSLMVGVGPAAKPAIFLSAWTAHGHIGTVLTAIPVVRTKHPPANRALIKETTGIGRHRAYFRVPQNGQGRVEYRRTFIRGARVKCPRTASIRDRKLSTNNLLENKTYARTPQSRDTRNQQSIRDE